MRFAAPALLTAFLLASSTPSSASTSSHASSVQACKELRTVHAKAKATRGALLERRRVARKIRETGCR